MPNRMSERISEDMPARVSERMSEDKSEKVSETMSERPQRPAPDGSVPCRTSPASTGRQCSPPQDMPDRRKPERM